MAAGGTGRQGGWRGSEQFSQQRSLPPSLLPSPGNWSLHELWAESGDQGLGKGRKDPQSKNKKISLVGVPQWGLLNLIL